MPLCYNIPQKFCLPINELQCQRTVLIVCFPDVRNTKCSPMFSRFYYPFTKRNSLSQFLTQCLTKAQFVMYEFRRSRDLFVTSNHIYFCQNAQQTNLYIVTRRQFTTLIYRFINTLDRYITMLLAVGWDILSQKLNLNILQESKKISVWEINVHTILCHSAEDDKSKCAIQVYF